MDPKYPRGFRYLDQASLNHAARELHKLGYQLHFHVIGDAATRAALDAVESIGTAGIAGVGERRHRTTHTYLVHPKDLSRFAALGVTADFQAGPESTDVEYHDYLAEFIGDRADNLLPTAKLLAVGAAVSLSSDWDADPLSPLGTLERALSRETNAVPNLETALSLVTLAGAYALRIDDETGSLEVGKAADYVVLSDNLFEIEAAEISEVEVLMTVLEGRVVYRDASLFP